jgi:hypothetical protein
VFRKIEYLKTASLEMAAMAPTALAIVWLKNESPTRN